jgi:hypothetical protein
MLCHPRMADAADVVTNRVSFAATNSIFDSAVAGAIRIMHAAKQRAIQIGTRAQQDAQNLLHGIFD